MYIDHTQYFPFISQESKLTTSLFYSEEADVDTRSPEKDVEVFKFTCSDVRQTMLDIKSLKDKKAVSITET